MLARLLRDLALPGEETPWEFVVDALPRIDSFGKVLGLAFFAIILTFMNAMAECSPTTRSGSDFCSRFLTPIGGLLIVGGAILALTAGQSMDREQPRIEK